MNPFWMVAADLRKNFLSGLGTLLLLAFAFSISVAAGLFERGVTESGAKAADDFTLVIGAPGSRLDLVLASVFLRTDEVLPLMDYDIAEKLEKDPRVAASSPFVLADNYRGMPIVGVGSRFPELRPSLALAGGSWPRANFEATVGAEAPLSLGEEFESSHGVAGHGEAAGGEEREQGHEKIRYRVVGKLAATGTPWDRAILTPFTSLWEIHGHHEGIGHEEEIGHEAEPGHERPGISALLVKPANFSAAYSLRAQYREGKTTSAFPGEVLASVFGLVGDARVAVSALSSMVQLLVFAAVILSLMASLPSKYRWIGLLRSLGASRFYIFLTLWIQSAVVFLLAGGLGLAIGRLMAGILASAMGSGTGLKIVLSWSARDILPLVIFWLVGLCGALIPAFAGFRVSARKAVLGQ